MREKTVTVVEQLEVIHPEILRRIIIRLLGGDNLNTTVQLVGSILLTDPKSVNPEIRRRIMTKMKPGIRRNHHTTLARKSNDEIDYGCSGVSRSL